MDDGRPEGLRWRCEGLAECDRAMARRRGNVKKRDPAAVAGAIFAPDRACLSRALDLTLILDSHRHSRYRIPQRTELARDMLGVAKESELDLLFAKGDASAVLNDNGLLT